MTQLLVIATDVYCLTNVYKTLNTTKPVYFTERDSVDQRDHLHG